ncbi:MAG TPA: hypothetical protein VFS21_04235 [Roseiflexaceae bacterium]|nr:hypothetical protein [Roseiflexaceae bacterium]
MTRYHRPLALFALLTLLLTVLAPASATRAADAPPLTTTSPWPGAIAPHGIFGGSTLDVTVAGSTAYVIQGLNLVTLDVSDPAQPRKLGQLTLGSRPAALAVAEGFAYVLVEAGAVQIVDVRNPASPALAGSYTLKLSSFIRYTMLAVVGDYLYIGGVDPNALHVVDVRNPASPRRTALLPLDHRPEVIKAAGSLAYVVIQDSAVRLLVLDVGNPATPAVRGTLTLTERVEDLTVMGSTVLLAQDSGLGLVSVANPSAPSLVGRFATEAEPLSIVRDGNRAYLVSKHYRFDSTLHILDIQTPTAPQLLGSVLLPYQSVRVPVRGGLAYIVPGDEGAGTLKVVDLSSPTAPVTRGSYSDVGPLMRLRANGSLLVGLEGGLDRSIVWTLESRAGATPLTLGRLVLPGMPGDLDTGEGLAYAATTRMNEQAGRRESELRVIDLADPAAPAVRGTLVLTGSAGPLHLADQRVYLGVDDTVQIIDVSTPAQPALIGEVRAPSQVFAIAAAGGRVYVLSYSYLQIFDVSTPASPVRLAMVNVFAGRQRDTLLLQGNALYHGVAGRTSAGRYGQIYRYDVSDPTDPQRTALIQSWGTPGQGVPINDMVARPGQLIAATAMGMLLLDTTSPGRLEIQSTWWGRSDAYALALSGQQLHIYNAGAGLASYTLLDPRIWLPQASKK